MGEAADEEAAFAVVEEVRRPLLGEGLRWWCCEEEAELRSLVLVPAVFKVAAALALVGVLVVAVRVAAAVGSDSLSGCGAPLRPIAVRGAPGCRTAL